jgi:hypothetical protein
MQAKQGDRTRIDRRIVVSEFGRLLPIDEGDDPIAYSFNL